MRPLWKTIHYHHTDPGLNWVKDFRVAIEEESPAGVCHAITPNVVRLDDGRYRMYYSALVYGDRQFENSTAVIKSAISDDAIHWEQESGNRLESFSPDATLRVLCPDVIPHPDGGYRMYFEASCLDRPSRVLSAVSKDGLDWMPEPGIRMGDDVFAYGSPRGVYDDEGRTRLYFHRAPYAKEADSERRIMSAISDDGVDFTIERDAGIVQEGELESLTVYAPEVIRIADGSYRMYYAGWCTEPIHGRILSATSADGLNWKKDPGICLDYGGDYQEVKVSEPCVIELADGSSRLFYEANDASGRWRIMSAANR